MIKSHTRSMRRALLPRQDRRQLGDDAAVTCAAATGLIGDYLADNLEPADRRAFEAHLSGCRDCAAFLATYKRTIDLTKSFLARQSLQAPPVGFKLRLPSAR